MNFEKVKLDNFDFLEPYIDKLTMETHSLGHHEAYFLNLEKITKAESINLTLEEILGRVSNYSQDLINNAGGVWNHNFFFQSLSLDSQIFEAPQTLKLINQSFGDYNNFCSEFKKESLSLFGSGWVWLVFSPETKSLKLIKTENQYNPLMDIIEKKEGKLIPILAIDLWEHAYYLNYKNKRIDYINNFFYIINWLIIEERLNKLI